VEVEQTAGADRSQVLSEGFAMVEQEVLGEMDSLHLKAAHPGAGEVHQGVGEVHCSGAGEAHLGVGEVHCSEAYKACLEAPGPEAY